MSTRRWLAFSAALLSLAVIFSFPLILYFPGGMPYSFMPAPGLELLRQHPGDYIQLMYRFWLFQKALAGDIPFFTNFYEFSTPVTPPMFTTQGIPISFIFMLFMPFGNISAYNFLVILSFLAAGISMALLVGAFTGSPAASAVCGLLYACIPYRLGHLYGGHIGGFVFFLVPLSLYCLEMAWRRAEAGRSRLGSASTWGFCCGLCVLCASFTELHIVFYMGALLAAFFLARLAGQAAYEGVGSAVRVALVPVFGMIIPLALAVGYLLWVKFCYLATSVAVRGRSLRNVQAYSPGIMDMFYKSPNAEKNIYLGLVPVLAAAYGFWARRMEIAARRAGKGALLMLYFWATLFAASYLLSLGTTLEARIPMYAWLHGHVPFMAYSRTSSRIMAIALVGFFQLVGYGVRGLSARGRHGLVAVAILTVIALVEYHPKGYIGISKLRGMDSVYKLIKAEDRGKRLLELPIWPGDSAWSAIYEYYATLTSVPIVNGYNPVPQLDYIDKVFEPLRSLNSGEMGREQYETLKSWNVPHIVLHQDLFPRRVSRYPFRFTLLNLMNSPYLNFVMRDGPDHLFGVREKPSGPDPHFTQTSPVANIYTACRMKSDVGGCIQDAAAASGYSVCAGTHGEGAGLLMRGNSRFFPTGDYKLFVNIKSDSPRQSDQVAGIDVYDSRNDKVLAERVLAQSDFGRPGQYGIFELPFSVSGPTALEFRVRYLGKGVLRADFAYVIFAKETDPCPGFEAEDLFHIGYCVEDSGASGKHAVEIGKNEDLSVPAVSGPDRLYMPGRYRAGFYVRGDEFGEGALAVLEVVSAFGGDPLAKRDIRADEISEGGGYAPFYLEFELGRPTPLSFLVKPYNKALLWIDRIEVEKVGVMERTTDHELRAMPKARRG